MITSNQLYSYTNGNCKTTLLCDGTKIREYEDIPRPDYPESVDLKITDYCDAGCGYCHENSTVKGKHAHLHEIVSIFDSMIHPMEVAIGGGNPLEHPYLINLLKFFRYKGFISNITVNHKHIDNPLISQFIVKGLIRGLGISYDSTLPLSRFSNYRNTVIHLIVGAHDPQDLISLHAMGFKKFLILGFKKYGRGQKFFDHKTDKVNHSIYQWRFFIEYGIKKPSDLILSFDNLSIKQLDIKSIVSSKVWEENYMGDDGDFTFYIDAVKQEYCLSSYSTQRFKIENMSLQQMFKSLNKIN